MDRGRRTRVEARETAASFRGQSGKYMRECLEEHPKNVGEVSLLVVSTYGVMFISNLCMESDMW